LLQLDKEKLSKKKEDLCLKIFKINLQSHQYLNRFDLLAKKENNPSLATKNLNSKFA
jgi:hypothetical protein